MARPSRSINAFVAELSLTTIIKVARSSKVEIGASLEQPQDTGAFDAVYVGETPALGRDQAATVHLLEEGTAENRQFDDMADA